MSTDDRSLTQHPIGNQHQRDDGKRQLSDSFSDLPPMIRQGQLIEELAASVAAGVNGPWQKLTYNSTQLASFRESEVVRTSLDGSSGRIRMPRSISSDMVRELRSVMYRPGSDTWYSISLTITQPGDLDVKFNYADEPVWDDPVSPHLYATDQELFPRDQASQPEWLKKQLALAAAQ